MKVLTLLCLVTIVSGLETPTPSPTGAGSCAVSQMTRDSAPSDPNVGSGRAAFRGSAENWYINADRTIWAGPVPAGGWPSGGTLSSGGGIVKGQKTYWVRPAGQQLVIAGHRIDGPAPALEAHVPCCYPTGFQIVALFFPTDGCWEVSANAGDRELTFVTQVKSSHP